MPPSLCAPCTVLAGAITTLLLVAYFIHQWQTSVWGLSAAAIQQYLTEERGYAQGKEGKRYAYVQYATDLNYFCSALINAQRLVQLGIEHELVIMYPTEWSYEVNNDDTPYMKALSHAHTLISPDQLHLLPIEPLLSRRARDNWLDSLTKLHIYRLYEYDRIIYLDAASLVLNSMDHLFDLPSTPVAAPAAYWLQERPSLARSRDRPQLTNHVMLVEPSPTRFKRILRAIWHIGDDTSDMDVLHSLFGSKTTILPHRQLALLVDEFRSTDHTLYLSPGATGGQGEGEDLDWAPVAEARYGMLVNFGDESASMPWHMHRNETLMAEYQPDCLGYAGAGEGVEGDRDACPDRSVWWGLYDQWSRGHDEVCGWGL